MINEVVGMVCTRHGGVDISSIIELNCSEGTFTSTKTITCEQQWARLHQQGDEGMGSRKRHMHEVAAHVTILQQMVLPKGL